MAQIFVVQNKVYCSIEKLSKFNVHNFSSRNYLTN